MSRVRVLHFLKDWWEFIRIHKYYTMALIICSSYYFIHPHIIPSSLSPLLHWDKNKFKTLLLHLNIQQYIFFDNSFMIQYLQNISLLKHASIIHIFTYQNLHDDEENGRILDIIYKRKAQMGNTTQWQ